MWPLDGRNMYCLPIQQVMDFCPDLEGISKSITIKGGERSRSKSIKMVVMKSIKRMVMSACAVRFGATN